jgi:hypothetical protein
MTGSRMQIMRQRSHYPTLSYGELREILPIIVDERLERFEARIGPPSGIKGCWEWQGGSRTRAGYGLVQGSIDYRGYSFLAHRVAWALAHNVEPNNLIIRHSCDNQACCRWDHLLSGTMLDNYEDMVRRGRRRISYKGRPIDETGRAEAIRLRFEERRSIRQIAIQLRRHRTTIIRWLAWHVKTHR